MKIAINPGHYDSLDSGAVGQNGTHEANVVYSIAQRLQQRLNDEAYQTVFISSNELQEICDIANTEQADYFISIHANACDNPDVQGAETWYMSDTGKELATSIQAQLAVREKDRGIKNSVGLYVLRHTAMPAVLVECAFISNADEEAFLSSDEGQDFFAESIYRGLEGYLNE